MGEPVSRRWSENILLAELKSEKLKSYVAKTLAAIVAM